MSFFAADDVRQYRFFREERGYFRGYPEDPVELHDVLAGICHTPADGIIMFENLGIGIEDVVMAQAIFRAAEATDAGSVLEL